MSTTNSGGGWGRRRFLATTAVLGVAGATGFPVGRAAAQEAVDLSEWFADVSNFTGVVDERGSDRVTVAVGAEGNGGGFALSPAAVHVDPGTRIIWEWTGADGPHRFAADDGSYTSPERSSG